MDASRTELMNQKNEKYKSTEQILIDVGDSDADIADNTQKIIDACYCVWFSLFTFALLFIAFM